MFDLYKLSENEGKGSIRAVFTEQLKKDFLDCIKEIKNQEKITDFCENIGIDYTTFWDYSKRRNYVPLFLLKELGRITKRDFRLYIRFLEAGTGPTKNKSKAIMELTGDLAKIIGAYAADGCLRKRITEWNGKKVTHYELIFREEFESNVKALAGWLNEVFGIESKVTKEKNHYCIYISNKIIFRYFTNVFGFSSGRKTETIAVPDFVKNSSKNIKKSFITGVLMFDGSVGYRNGYVELCIKSKALTSDIILLLNSIGIKPDYQSLNPDKFGRYLVRIRKLEKLRMCLELFEPNTEKWWRLKEHLYGFDGRTKSLNRLITNLDEYYPNVRESVITISDIINSIDSLQNRDKVPDFKNISESLNKGSTVIYEYLRKLERLGILKTKKQGQRKIWFLNGEFPYPKRGD